MTSDTAELPLARSWRDIPQQVKPRAMTRGGRRRLVLAVLRWTGAAAVAALVAAGTWQVVVSLKDPAALPADTRAVPVKSVVLVDPDGVLDRAWLVRTLALPATATLDGLDLTALRAKVLASGQVAAATLYREYPATLSVHLSERSPIVRIMAQDRGGAPTAYLVARDGTVYQGSGYSPAVVGSLPWLDGVALHRKGAGFERLDGAAAVGDLLATAKLTVEPLYRTWRVVSLEHYAADGDIGVRTADGLTVTFGTQEDYSAQLAKLDYLLDALRARGAPAARTIDLSLAYASHQVPVTLAPPPPSS